MSFTGQALLRIVFWLELWVLALAGREDTKKVPGCYLRGARYLLTDLHHVTNPIEDVFDYLECQMLCSKAAGCTRFVYFSKSLLCYLGAGDTGVAGSDDAVSGPDTCPEDPPACSQLPHMGRFPGETPEESQRAWPMNYTPTQLQCWPQNANQQPAFCKLYSPVLLQNFTDAGRCADLQRVTLPEEESCGQNCAGNLLCSAWQERPGSGEAAGVSDCYQGVGGDCFGPEGPEKLLDAGRFQHGAYRVLASLQQVQLMGLSLAFRSSDLKKAPRRCKLLCLSLLPCQAWQYSDGFGCYVENPYLGPLPYPPVVQRSTAFAQKAQGEYLQRLCPNSVSRVRGDAKDEEVQQQEALVVSYAAKATLPKKVEADSVDVPKAPPIAQAAVSTTELMEPPLSPSTDAILPPLAPAGAPLPTVAPTPALPAAIPTAALPTAAPAAALPATVPTAALPTAAPAAALPTAVPAAVLPTVAPAALPTAAPTAIWPATLPPSQPLPATPALPTAGTSKAGLPGVPPTPTLPTIPPPELPRVSTGAEFRKSDITAAGYVERSPVSPLPKVKKSFSDWLAISLGVVGLVLVCAAAHLLRVHKLRKRRKGGSDEATGLLM